MNDNDFINFLLVAKRNTYAGKKNQVESIRKGSSEYRYQDGDYLYIDSYVGNNYFSGQEIVYYKEKVIWSMNYVGRVIGDNFSGDFLKEALLKNTVEMPYRGPIEYINGSYKYNCHVEGHDEWFNGYEEIKYDNTRIYELFFCGGIIV